MLRILLSVSLILSVSGCCLFRRGEPHKEHTKVASLQKVLDGKRSQSQAPAQARSVMEKAQQELTASGILDEVAISVGDTLPNATLQDVDGKEVQLYKVLGTGPSVITFYRGEWCPYCNIQLQHYQEHLVPMLSKYNATLVAISPETPDRALTTKERNKLGFTVLSDEDNRYGKKLHAVFPLSSELAEVYKGFGIDLQKANSSQNWELPLALTVVTDASRKVVYVFKDVDYTKRAEPSAIVHALHKATHTGKEKKGCCKDERDCCD